MMPVARRASLVVVLILLASVGTASAECAWVLWQRVENQAPPKAVQQPVSPGGWQPVATEGDRVACWDTEQALRQTDSNVYLALRGNRVQLAGSKPWLEGRGACGGSN